MDFWLLKKGQWNLAIPRTVLERDYCCWMGHDKQLVHWTGHWAVTWEVVIVMKMKDWFQLLLPVEEVTSHCWWVSCKYNVCAWNINFCHLCQGELNLKSSDLRLHAKAHTPLTVYSSWFLQYSHAVNHAKPHTHNDNDVNYICLHFPRNNGIFLQRSWPWTEWVLLQVLAFSVCHIYIFMNSSVHANFCYFSLK